MLDEAVDLDRVFRALADGSRRSMVARLGAGPASVTELAEPLQMSLAAVLQHVQVLEACGLVVTTKVGRTRRCTVDPEVLRTAETWLAEGRSHVERQLDRLGEHLTAHHPKERS